MWRSLRRRARSASRRRSSAARIGSASTLRISLPMNCRCRTPAPRLVMSRAATIASWSVSGRSSASSSAGGSSISASPSDWRSSASRLRALLLGASSGSSSGGRTREMLARRGCAAGTARMALHPGGSRRMNDLQTPAPPARGPDLLALVDVALREAKARGAEQSEAAVSVDVGLSVSVRLGEVETVEYQRDRGMGVTVYFGQRKGSASTADLSPRAVAETVEKACDIARYTAADDCAGLADPDELAREIPDLDLDHPWDLSPEDAVETARACEAAGRVVDTRITNSEGASVGSHRGVRVYGNSHGFLAGYPSTSHSVSCVLLAQTGDDMQRDYWYSSARDARDLESSESIGQI